MIYIVVRRTIDWGDERAFRAQLSPEFRPKVELWDRTFGMPFHRFRQRLKAIAELNLAAVRGATCVPFEAVPADAIFLPVDDDDWFAPDTAEVLERARDPGVLGYYWTSSMLEVPVSLRHKLTLFRRKLQGRGSSRWICATNNYALVRTADCWERFRTHMEATRWMTEDLRRAKRIDARLSLMNRTLASQTSLAYGRPNVGRAKLLFRYWRYRKLYSRSLPPDLHWATPYAAMMAELMAELELSI